MNSLVLVTFSLIFHSDATLLFWSNQNIKLPTLKNFNEEDFENLLVKLNRPHILAFQNDYSTINNIPHNLENFYSAYVPNGNMYIENVTELTEDMHNNLEMINKSVAELNNSNRNHKNVLIIISSPNIRAKRNTNEVETVVADDDQVNEQVLYFNSDSGSGIAMIYSSKYLTLRTNTDNYTLKHTKKTTLTDFGTYSVLAATIPLEKRAITLKFRFQNSWGYWTLPTVQVDGVDTKSITLNSSKTIRAERNYSYHCFGETVFKGSNVELVLYDIQVQPYGRYRKFSEAYDCVPFTTVPIWSGLMVSFTLILGLFLGFGALASIKTMDKFDTSKTKQLPFAVSE